MLAVTLGIHTDLRKVLFHFIFRTFTSEEGSSKYTYPNEQKVYPRVSRGGTSTGGSSTFPTRNHRSGASGTHPDTNSRRRNLDETHDEAFEHGEYLSLK